MRSEKKIIGKKLIKSQFEGFFFHRLQLTENYLNFK